MHIESRFKGTIIENLQSQRTSRVSKWKDPPHMIIFKHHPSTMNPNTSKMTTTNPKQIKKKKIGPRDTIKFIATSVLAYQKVQKTNRLSSV